MKYVLEEVGESTVRSIERTPSEHRAIAIAIRDAPATVCNLTTK